jgi:hypothetical protein
MEIVDFVLEASPFSPGLEVPFGMAVKRHVPYSAKSVTVQVSPNITHYQEDAGPGLRHQTVYSTTAETKTLLFDLEKNRRHTVEFEGGQVAFFRYEFRATRQ